MADAGVQARHLLLLEVAQTNEHLQREATDERQGQPLKLVVLDELIPAKSNTSQRQFTRRKNARTS